MNERTVKILKNVILGFVLSVDLIWMVVWLFGSIMQTLTHQADVAEAFMPVMLVHALWLTSITIGQIVRNNKGKKLVLMTGLLMKIYTLLVWFSFMTLFCLDEKDPGIIIGSFSLDIIIAVSVPLYRYLYKKKIFDVSASPRFTPVEKVNKNMDMPRFRPLTVNAVWGDAASEYCRLNGKKLELLDENERRRITICAATPAAYILTWLARRNLLNEGSLSSAAADILPRIKSLDEDPALFLLDYMDGRISTPDIKNDALLFANVYFQYNPFSPCRAYTQNFMFDYYDVIQNNEGRYYCEPFSAKKYLEVEEKTDAALQKFDMGDDPVWRDDYVKKGTAYFAMLNCQVDVIADRSISQSEYDRCINQLAQRDPETTISLCEQLMTYCSTDIALYVSEPLRLLEKLHASEVIIPALYMNQTAFIVICESELEPEHGISFTIRDGELIEVCYASDAGNPWTLAADMEYRLKKEARQASLRYVVDEKSFESAKSDYLQEVYTIPVSFNSDQNRADAVYLPSFAAQLKFRCDKMIRALSMTGYAIGGVTYECYPSFEPYHPVPRRLRIIAKRKTDGQTLFDDIIHVW